MKSMTTETTTQEDAKKIWEQLDAEDSGNAPEPEVPSEQPEPAQAEEKVEEVAASEDDPKVLRDKIAGLEATLNQLAGRVRNTEGHIGGLNSAIKQQIETARKVQESGAQAPSASEISAAQANPEIYKNLEAEYPEFAKAMKPVMEAEIAAQVAALRKQMPQQQPAPSQDNLLSRQELEQFKAELRVESKHPGWQATAAKPEFAGWLQSQPYEVQMLANSPQPEHAIRLFDIYAESRKPSTPSQRNASAAALPTGTRSSVRTKNVDEMSPKEYWAFLDSQDKLKAT
jgi:hypothetical protein